MRRMAWRATSPRTVADAVPMPLEASPGRLRTLRAALWSGLEAASHRPAAIWVLATAFLAYGSSILADLQNNFDEGLYIQQALLIVRGELPYRDFFCHQTPLYLFTLAAIGYVFPHSLFAMRFLSLASTALAGVFVYRIAARLTPRGAAIAAALMFYVVPIQFYGLLAMPAPVMLLCQVAGTYYVLFRQHRARVVWGSVLLVLAILFKPLALAGGIAVGVVLLASPHQRRKVPWVLSTGVLATIVALGVFDWVTDGSFLRMMLLQARRYADKGGFDVMMEFLPFRHAAEGYQVGTAVEWNVRQHEMTFLWRGELNANLWLLVLGLGGQAVVWRRRGGRWAGGRLLLTLWWIVPVIFSIWVWEPIWDHYFVQYLPSLAILGAILLRRVWRLPARHLPVRGAAALALAGITVFGLIGQTARRGGHLEQAGLPVSPGEAWLTFDPFLNFITQTRPLCDVIDPFNAYGERSLLGRSLSKELVHYYRGPADLIRCLQDDPRSKVFFGSWAEWFAEPELRAYIRSLPPGRLLGRVPAP